MAMDFPIDPVDRLPIFTEEAESAVAHIRMLGAGDLVQMKNRRTNVVGNGGRPPTRNIEIMGAACWGQIGSAAPYGEQPSVAAGGGAMSAFSQSEKGSLDVIEHGVTEGPVNGDQLAVIESVLRVMIQHPYSLLARWIRKPHVGLKG